MQLQTSNTLKRIAGRKVQVEAEYDGVQRREWISDGRGGSVGRVTTGKWSPVVWAYRANAEHTTFSATVQGSKVKALAAARKWIVEGML